MQTISGKKMKPPWQLLLNSYLIINFVYIIFHSSGYFCNVLSVHMTEFRDITKLHVQRNDHLASLLIYMEKENKLSQPAREIIGTIIYSPIN